MIKEELPKIVAHIELVHIPLDNVEYCCKWFKFFSLFGNIEVKLVKRKEDNAGVHRYVTCPYCNSTLIVDNEDMVIVHKPTQEPREWKKVNER